MLYKIKNLIIKLFGRKDDWNHFKQKYNPISVEDEEDLSEITFSVDLSNLGSVENPLNYMWTCVLIDGNKVIIPGYKRTKNKISYIITENPWINENERFKL